MKVLFAAVFGCETWSEERLVRMWENKAVRRIFGPKVEDVTGGWGGGRVL